MPTLTGLDPTQVRDLIIRPTLSRLSLPSPACAERLLMGTIAQESQFRYLHQLGGGPALGLFQMEPFTAQDLWDRFSVRFKLMDWVVPGIAPVSQLVWNLQFAAAMCRIHYWARPFTLPERIILSPDELAAIWKKHYNTEKGKGKPTEFIKNYQTFVEPVYD